MRIKLLVGLLSFIFCVECHSTIASASSETPACGAQPAIQPAADQRWTYWIDRLSGQKCWLLVARRERVQQQERTASSWDNPFDFGTVEKAAADCLAEPDGL